MKIRIAVSLFVLLASASLCFGQKSNEKTSYEQRDEQLRLYEGLFPKSAQDASARRTSPANAPTRISAPRGKGTWAVQMESGGGFAGKNITDVTINSLGEVTCGPSADVTCAYRLSLASLESLSKLIADATPSKWGASAESVCRDCRGTRMELHRRDAKGREKVYILYWDESTFANVPEEARHIFSEASARTQAQAQAAPQKN